MSHVKAVSHGKPLYNPEKSDPTRTGRSWRPCESSSSCNGPMMWSLHKLLDLPGTCGMESHAGRFGVSSDALRLTFCCVAYIGYTDSTPEGGAQGSLEGCSSTLASVGTGAVGSTADDITPPINAKNASKFKSDMMRPTLTLGLSLWGLETLSPTSLEPQSRLTVVRTHDHIAVATQRRNQCLDLECKGEAATHLQ